MKYMYRRLNENDVNTNKNALLRLLNTIFKTSNYVTDSMITAQKYYENMKIFSADGSAIVVGAFCDKELAGFHWGYKSYRGGGVYIHSSFIGVDEQYQNKGIGSQLQLEMEKEAIKLGIHKMDTNVDITNEQSLLYHKKMGFHVENYRMVKEIETPMIIYGKKILLRALEVRDAQLLMEIINDPETENMLGGSSYPVSYDKQCEWIRNQKNDNGIFRAIIGLQSDMEHGIGTVILTNLDMKNGTAEVHIKLATEGVRGKGYGKDALETIVKYAFSELRLHCIYAHVLEYNTASIGLFEKCGFTKEGILQSRIYKNGMYVNFLSFSKVKDD